jgi:Ser/Thr protein kinase RdoA (MazF antagonist)
VLLTPVAGVPLAELPGQVGTEGFARLGDALARLHRLPAFELKPFRRLDPERMNGAAELVARVRPDVAPQARELARRLGARTPATHEPPVCLHGDVNSRNWLLADGGVGLIDLDQLGLGPAAADLGGALATIYYRARADRWPGTVRRAMSEALLRGYAGVRPLPDDRSLRWHTAAALLVERVLRAVTRVRPAGLLMLEELLAAAGTLLEGRDND